MNRPPPPLNFIRSFECAARHLSFTLAAKELGFTPAAISTHIRCLEQYVGRPLFLRNPRSLKLTDMGEGFLPTLRQGLNQIDSATEAIVTGARDQTVILACPMSLAENWVAHMLIGFSVAHPEIEVVVQGTVWENADDPIADLTITINRDDEVPRAAVKLWRDLVALVCAPALAVGITHPKQVLELPKIFVLARQEYWTIIADKLDMGRVDLDKGLKTNASNIALEMTAAGLGYTASLASLTRIYTQRQLLVEPFQARSESPWSYYLTENNISRSGAAKRLRDWIIAAGLSEGEFSSNSIPR